MSVNKPHIVITYCTQCQWLLRAAQLSAMSTLPRWAWSQNAKLQHNPFSLGIASGDPSPDGFVLWTRLMPTAAPPSGTALPPEMLSAFGPQTVRWEVAREYPQAPAPKHALDAIAKMLSQYRGQ